MAVVGTQTGNYETGDENHRAQTPTTFSYRYPVTAWYPSGSAIGDVILDGAISVGGGGASIYTRPG